MEEEAKTNNKRGQLRQPTRRALTSAQRHAMAIAQFEIAARRKEVARLIAGRYSHREIADILGVSPGTVQADKNAIMAEWAQTMIADIAEVFMSDAAMLNMIQQRLLERVDSGDMSAMELVLRVLKRRASMFGLDAKERRDAGIHLMPPEEPDGETAEVLTPDGRPAGKGAAARIYAAFATPVEGDTEPGPEPVPDGGGAPKVG